MCLQVTRIKTRSVMFHCFFSHQFNSESYNIIQKRQRECGRIFDTWISSVVQWGLPKYLIDKISHANPLKVYWCCKLNLPYFQIQNPSAIHLTCYALKPRYQATLGLYVDTTGCDKNVHWVPDSGNCDAKQWAYTFVIIARVSFSN